MSMPKIGDYIEDNRLGRCVIVAVHITEYAIDVRALDGQHYRISGLFW